MARDHKDKNSTQQLQTVLQDLKMQAWICCVFYSPLTRCGFCRRVTLRVFFLMFHFEDWCMKRFLVIYLANVHKGVQITACFIKGIACMFCFIILALLAQFLWVLAPSGMDFIYHVEETGLFVNGISPTAPIFRNYMFALCACARNVWIWTYWVEFYADLYLSPLKPIHFAKDPIHSLLMDMSTSYVF